MELFSFYIPTSERKSGIGWEAGKEGTDSKATQGNVCDESGEKLLLSRAVPVYSLVLQKPHQLCEFVSRFLLQSPSAWDEFSHCIMFCCLTLCATGGWRSLDPVQALSGSFHRSQKKAGLTHFLFSFYILALCPYKTSQCGCRLKGTCWKRGEGLEISTDWEVLLS